MKNGLKRSSSAPLINQLVAAEPVPGPATRLRGSYLPAASRWRRWSTSISPVSPGGGAQAAGWARLNKLRVEETKDQAKREIATEREVQRGIHVETNLSQSWEDLSLTDVPKEQKSHVSRRLVDHMTPLTIGVGPFPSPRTSPSPSPSPTRSNSATGKQCFSPSMQMPVPNLSFSPSPSSSPTRRTWASRRSLSPITLRPSALGPVKRKCMLDEGDAVPAKRHSSSLLITHHNSNRSAPYRLPWPSGSNGNPSTSSREGSPSPMFPTPQESMETGGTASPQETSL